MILSLNKLSSKYQKRITLNFLNALYKTQTKSESLFFPFILSRFPFVSNAMNIFIHS